MAQTVGCYDAKVAPPVKKACMIALTPLQITNLTYVGDWGPIVDGVVVPEDPMARQLRHHFSPSLTHSWALMPPFLCRAFYWVPPTYGMLIGARDPMAVS